MRSNTFLIRLCLAASPLAFACNAPLLGGAPAGGGGGLTALANPPALLTPEAYADTARALAEAVAELNRAQAQTIEHLRGTPAEDLVDADLMQVGAAAMTVAQLAEQLAASTANQDGGSADADKAARPYLAAAQVGYLIVIEAQNLREDYKAGGVSAEQVSDKIAETGGMLWSADEFDPSVNPQPFADARTNPVTAPPAGALPADNADSVRSQIDQSSGKSSMLSTWSASSGTKQTVTVMVPAPRSLAAADALDPATLNQMRTPEGQADADRVRAVASARLTSLGAMNDRSTAGGSYGVTVSVPASQALQSQFGTKAMPYYADGTSSATATADTGGPLVSSVSVQNDEPVVERPFEVTNATPLITLSITNATQVSGHAPVLARHGRGRAALVPPRQGGSDLRAVQVTVSWESTLADTAFTVGCYAGNGGSASTTVSGASGETTLTVSFGPQRETAVCQAFLNTDAPPVGFSQVVAVEADPNAALPAPPTETPALPAPGVETEVPPTEPPTAEPATAAPEPTATTEEALPPAGHSSWFVGFGEPSASGDCPPVPLESESTTMDASEDRSTLLMTASGGDATFTRTGGSTYTWSDEAATMTVTFTSPRHAEGDYVVSAEGCTINWPTTWDREE